MQAAISISDFEKAISRIPLLVNASRLAILVSLLTIFFMFRHTNNNVVHLAMIPFTIWAVIYATAIALSLFFPRWAPGHNNIPAFHDLFDIMMMVGLMHLTGGIDNGFGILILPFIATSCLLSSGQHALVYSGFASLLIFISTLVLQDAAVVSYQNWFNNGEFVRHLFSTGLLTICCFLVAALTSFVSMNIKRASQTVHAHEAEITRLNHLNDLVLNRLQEAVLVIDKQGSLWLHNSQASTYFPSLSLGDSTYLFLPVVHMWRESPEQAFELDYVVQDEDLHIRALPLLNQNPPLLILFVRRQQEIAAEAQSHKLVALGQLTTNIAHEIRNPLSAIRHANELLRESHTTRPMQKLGAMIETNVQRINHIIEEVLTLNRCDRLTSVRINLEQFIHNFLQEFLLATPDAKNCVRLHISKQPMMVLFDVNHLQQILWNLMNNAWHHSQKNSKAIQISIKPHARAGLLLLQVADNGDGVAPANIIKLFEPFFTTEARGTGLGLYTARTLAQANRGDLIYVPSSQVFELILPTQYHEYSS